MYSKLLYYPVVIGWLLVSGSWSALLPGWAWAVETEKPERLITMAVEYPGIELPSPDEVDMNIIFQNKGRSDETVEVWVADTPSGWRTQLKTYKYTVTGMYVPSGETKTLTFKAEPDHQVQPGQYTFRIAAKTHDGHFKMEERVAVSIKAKKEEAAKVSKDLSLSTTYPVLRGPTDGTFEFSVEVDSHLDQDAVVDLAAEGPQDWTINFKPAYESKYISSLQIKANQSRNVSVEVKPPVSAQAGEYPMTMRASAAGKQAQLDLNVALTGTYKLDAGTPSGRLSLDAKPGKPANVSIFVKNTGSAVNHDIKFMTFKPENWRLELKPETIADLAPNAVQQVEVTIVPYEDALVGDYSVGIEVQGEKASKTLEFRTTVEASTAWAWIGIVIIAGVIGGLTELFRKFGRR
jgi:uncharacterized membrane protein